MDQQTLKEILHYNPDTGKWIWLKPLNKRIIVGSKAGSYDSKGYLQIGIFGNNYRAHRLAFLYMENILPKEVDHIDRNPSNCIWKNLKKCTHIENLANRIISRNQKTGRYSKG